MLDEGGRVGCQLARGVVCVKAGRSPRENARTFCLSRFMKPSSTSLKMTPTCFSVALWSATTG